METKIAAAKLFMNEVAENFSMDSVAKGLSYEMCGDDVAVTLPGAALRFRLGNDTTGDAGFEHVCDLMSDPKQTLTANRRLMGAGEYECRAVACAFLFAVDQLRRTREALGLG